MRSPGPEYMIAMNFGWLEHGNLAACRGPRSQKDLEFLASEGIKALVRLAFEDETGLTSEDVQATGIKDCYEPVQDFMAPSQFQICRVINFIQEAIGQGHPVAVSCGAGYGRTGTILACYLVSSGLSANDAIKQLILSRPCSEEILHVPGQKQAIIEFEQQLKSAKVEE
jgi:atypical dual specificity phosphatase